MSETNKYDAIFSNILNMDKMISETCSENELDFINKAYANTDFHPDSLEILYNSCEITDFDSLGTGDIACYSKDDKNIFGIITGVIDRNFSYFSPSGKTLRTESMAISIEGYSFYRGFSMQKFFR